MLSKQEVLDLGGNESDIEMLAGIDSDDEKDATTNCVISSEVEIKAELQRLIATKLSANQTKPNKKDTKEPVKVVQTIKQKPTKSSRVEVAKTVSVKKSSRMDMDEKLLFDTSENWYAVKLAAIPASEPASEDQIKSMYESAKQLYDSQVNLHQKSKFMSKHDSEFVNTVLRSGTVTDKVSALSLLIQQSPIYSFNMLQSTLLSMANKKSRREAIMAIDSIKDLLLSTLLPDRKLRFFRDQPLSAAGVTQKHLLLYYFEDSLKKLYFSFIQTIEELSKDTLLHVKNKMVIYIYDLLVAKPEQEQNLLALLVNKLGDQEKKIASKIVHLLSLLLQAHPNMKSIVIKESEQILFRQNISQRTQYYAITFLNQIVLSKQDSDVVAANRLVDVYFRLFEILVAQIKMGESVPIKAKIDKTKGPHKKGKGKNKKDMKKDTKKPTTHGPIIVDGINAKMMAGLLTGINRAFPYSKLDQQVFDNHINMLFTLTHIGTFNTCIQALSLLHQIQQNNQIITDRYYRALYQSLLDKRLLTASKQSLFLNLIYKSLKQDSSINRLRAFVKRMLQICGYLGIPFVCATLFLIGELARNQPGLWSMITVGEDGAEEVFIDAIDPDEIVHADVDLEQIEPVKSAGTIGTGYDGLKRDPLFCNAGVTCLWELIPFVTHFHPTVKLYAQTLLQCKSIVIPANATNYDPLQNHTLSRFLDRFVYKNPKNMHAKGSSLMQPSGHKTDDMFVVGGHKKRSGMLEDVQLDDTPVNVGEWKDERDVPVDEMFFYRFFASAEKKSEKKSVANVDSEDDEDEIWNAIQKSSGFPTDLKEAVLDDDVEEDWDGVVDSEDDSFANADENDANSDILDENSDGDMEAWIGEDEDATEIDTTIMDSDAGDDKSSSDSDNKKPIKGKRSITKMAEKAKNLGFTGDYFDRMLAKRKDTDADANEGIFASAEDFESLVDAEMDSEPDIVLETPSKKRKTGKVSRNQWRNVSR